MLSLATDIEGHPDNAAPALFGGVQCAVVAAGRIHRLTVEAPSLPAVVLFVPSFEMSTREARAVLAPTVSRNDAVFNLSRAALLVGALVSGRFDLLGVATEDRIHQPARSTIFPLLPALLDAARGAGAFGAWLSGAGSTIASFADDAHATAVAAAMEDCARSAGLDGRTLITSVDLAGASFSHVQ
jgi:homoserine kinase